MLKSLEQIIRSYHAETPLAHASTIPASWYVDPRVLELEHRTVFRRAWQVAGRHDDVRAPGDYLTCELPGGEPIVVVRGADRSLRAFYNVCRHHAAAVVTDSHGSATQFRCPYHGWTYGLDGSLKGTPDFAEVCDFDRSAQGLVPVECDVAEQWVFVRPERDGPGLPAFLGPALTRHLADRGLSSLQWMERRHYTLDCNWKVFVDNYLDGGYHVPHLHKGLDSVLDYTSYAIENGARFCLQSSPLVADGAEAATGAVRAGDRAPYFWIYPNFMINCYGGAMDTNLVLPLGVDRTEVLFDFYFADVSDARRAHNRASIEVADRIQEEDLAICASVQRGLRSRAYTSGRLSVRREAGEHLFHRLLHADLRYTLREHQSRGETVQPRD
jgi:choline monooxygenase